MPECGDSCGWIAAIVSMVAFGSFAVPIKGETATKVDIDPLVFQSYKTLVCFLSSWLVLLIGEEFSFTFWGIVSGLFWVPAGVATVYAVKNAGLAVTQGLNSALIVLVSFTWGIFIFEEGVRSKFYASLAVLLMMMGIWGMGYYSGRRVQPGYIETEMNDDDDNVESSEQDGSSDHDIELSSSAVMKMGVSVNGVHVPTEHIEHRRGADDVLFTIYGVRISRRVTGLAASAFDGIWGGSILVPMHFSNAKTGGLGYVISFAFGASVVTLFLWLIRYIWGVSCRRRSFVDAYYELPSFHWRKMWIPGFISGALWSIGNVASMVSVNILGEGVGYSVVQANLLVAGSWGIFYFKEVSSLNAIVKFCIAAVATVIGILFLSHEHIKST